MRPARVVDGPIVRLALVVLASALGLAAAQPALAGDRPDAKLGNLAASCQAQSAAVASNCVTPQKPGLELGRLAQSLCKGQLGARLGVACVPKLTALFASCKARSTGDGWKECLKAQLPKPSQPLEQPGTAVFDSGKLAAALCQGPLGVKLGQGCVTQAIAVLTSCKGQMSAAGDTFKACVTARLPLESSSK